MPGIKSMKPWLARTALIFAIILGICFEMPPLGCAQAQSGGGADHYRRRHVPNLEDQVKKLAQELNLDLAQQTKVKTILEHRQIQLRQVFNDASLSAVNRFNAMKAVHDKSDEQIRRILNADQASKFDQLRPRPLPKSETRHQDNGGAR